MAITIPPEEGKTVAVAGVGALSEATVLGTCLQDVAICFEHV